MIDRTQAIYTVVEHFSMHTGQIILLAKMWKPNLSFYDLSHPNPRRNVRRVSVRVSG